jgi:uncharacterized membrane protein YkoI
VDRRKLIIGGAAVILTLGAGGVAIAAQQGEEFIKGGSIAVPAGSGEEKEASENEANENETNEAAENEAEGQNLDGLARIDRTAAERAALDAVPGEVREVELESENGFVVYEVEVAANDGTLHEVVVDAGNGKVLAR